MRVYEKNGKKYLSVTSIISMMYEFDSSGFDLWAMKNHLSSNWITKHSAELGEKYHAYFENSFHKIGDWADEVDNKIDKGYRNSVDDFYSQGWEIVESEREVYCDEYNFAGRFDLIIRNKNLGIDKALGDIKTWGAWNRRMYKANPDKLKKLGTQLSMYRYAMGGEELPMFLIVPQKNGKCVIERIKAQDDWKDWIKANKEDMDKILQAS